MLDLMRVLGTDFPQERTSISGKCCACPSTPWAIHPGDHSNQPHLMMNAGIGKVQISAILKKKSWALSEATAEFTTSLLPAAKPPES